VKVPKEVHEFPVTIPESVTKSPTVTKSDKKPVTKSDKDRVYAWRKKNRAKYNEKQKELMKKRAAKAEYIKTHLEMIGDIKEVMRKKRAK